MLFKFISVQFAWYANKSILKVGENRLFIIFHVVTNTHTTYCAAVNIASQLVLQKKAAFTLGKLVNIYLAVSNFLFKKLVLETIPSPK